MHMSTVLIGCIAFMSGNFIYQAFTSEPSFVVAVERSWFQLVIVLFVWYMLKDTVKF